MLNRLYASLLREDRKEQLPQGIALIDAVTGKVYQVNTKFIETFGNCGQMDLIRLRQSDLLARDQDSLTRLQAGKIDCINIDQRYLQPDGSSFWINIKITLVNGTARPHPCLLWQVEDITADRQRLDA